MSKPVLFSLAITTFLTSLYAGVGLPANVSEIIMKVYEAFNKRLWFMITSFVLVILSVWSFIYKNKPA